MGKSYSAYEEMISDSEGIEQVKALNIARPRHLTHLGLERTPGHRIFPIIDASG